MFYIREHMLLDQKRLFFICLITYYSLPRDPVQVYPFVFEK